MARLIAVEIGQGARDMTVLGDDHAFLNPIPQTVRGGFGHLPGGFSRRHQQHPAGEGQALQRPADGSIRQDRGDRLRDDLVGVVPEELLFGFMLHLSFLSHCRRMPGEAFYGIIA